MQRETKEITLPSGKKVIVYTYMTAADAIAHKAVFMKAAKMDISEIKAGMTEVPFKGQIDGTILMDQEKVLVTSLVKECEGGVESMRSTDYDALVVELTKIKDGPLAPAK